MAFCVCVSSGGGSGLGEGKVGMGLINIYTVQLGFIRGVFSFDIQSPSPSYSALLFPSLITNWGNFFYWEISGEIGDDERSFIVCLFCVLFFCIWHGLRS
jgi:hypothetical protein